MRSLVLVSASALALLAAACAVDAGPSSDPDAPQVGGSEAALGFTLLPGYDIPTTGPSNPGFAKVDAAIRKLMDERCIGAAVIGVSMNGSVIHNKGFGYKSGPPNAKCATASDPFVGGAKMGAADPIRIGSNSKAIFAAVLRKHLKAALSAARGGAAVTDADIEALKLLDNGEVELVAPRVRAAMLATGGNVGDITNEVCVPKAWPKVTIGQLIGHTAGLSSSESAYEEMSKTRGLTSLSKMALQESASGAPAAARADLESLHGKNAFFVPTANLEELMVAQGDRCFASAPGAKYAYSNAGYTLLGYVLEHVTGRSFAGRNGNPASHATSLLAEMTNAELGFANGIEQSHTALGARDAAEPRYRDWSASQSTFYPLVGDDKRPWCIFDGEKCDFSKFTSGKTRFDWTWQKENVDHSYRSNSVAPGAGALAVEAPKMLAWMSKYTVGQPYGGLRSQYPGAHQHYGGLGGTASWARQFGTKIDYPGFGTNADGTTNFSIGKRLGGSCVIPKGIDVVFTINQTGDPKCTEANGCVVCANEDDDCKEKASAYSAGYYDGIVREALCAVDWAPAPQ